ncbi:MAG: LysR substrate-binding domain-containing protein [Pseudomonadota bacterium]
MNESRDIRLRHIRTFLEVARHESVSKAADALSTSQPAVSRSIAELERILGVSLFDRVGRGLELNTSGKTFQAHAATSMAELSRAFDRVNRGTRRQARLSIGTLPTASTDLVPNAVLEFQRFDDLTEIHVMTGPNWLLFNQLREGKLDLVVGRMPQVDSIQGLLFEQLYMERVVLVSRPGHPIRNADPRDVRGELGKYALILPPKGAVISGTVAGFLASIGMPDPRGSVETVALPVGRRLVEGSDALWFISFGVVADEIANGRLAAIDLQSPMLSGPVGISYLQSAPVSPERNVFAECLRSAVPR